MYPRNLNFISQRGAYITLQTTLDKSVKDLDHIKVSVDYIREQL